MERVELKKFAVLYFPSDKGVEVVPSRWLSEDQITCPFPLNRPKGLRQLQEDFESFSDPLWPTWAVDIKKTYDNFDRANKKAAKLLKSLSDPDSSAPENGSQSSAASSIDNQSGNRSSPPISDLIEFVDTGGTGQDFALNIQGNCSSPPISDSAEFVDTAATSQDITLNIQDERITTLLNEFRAFQETCISNQNSLKEEVNGLKSLVLRCLNQSSQGDLHIDIWPIKSQEEFVAANTLLSKKEVFIQQTVILSRIGGTSVSRTVNNILKFIIHHSFALKTRFTGTTGKVEFGNSTCAKLVREAAKKYHQPTTELTLSEDIKAQISDQKLDSFIAKWLRDSINRGPEGKTTRDKHGDSKVNKAATSSSSSSAAIGQNKELSDSDHDGRDE